jgi:hypothetical protein
MRTPVYAANVNSAITFLATRSIPDKAFTLPGNLGDESLNLVQGKIHTIPLNA